MRCRCPNIVGVRYSIPYSNYCKRITFFCTTFSCEPGTSAIVVNMCTTKVKGKRKRAVEEEEDAIINKITKMHETTVKLFLEHEKSILEKEKEDRQ